MSELVLIGILVPIGILAVTAFLNSLKARRERIREVARGYGERCHGPRRLNCGPHAFLQAGARELRSDKEVRSALASIVDRWGTERHPLGNDWRDLPDDIDLKNLVDQLSDNADNFVEICTKLVASGRRGRGVRARIKKVLAWAPAGEGFRRVALLVSFASVLLWAVEWIGQAGVHGSAPKMIAVEVAIGLLLAPLVWLLTWLASQTVFGALAWVVRGFR